LKILFLFTTIQFIGFILYIIIILFFVFLQGLAFTLAERKALKIEGLLPPYVINQDVNNKEIYSEKYLFQLFLLLLCSFGTT
jgi:hypothetical protein